MRRLLLLVLLAPLLTSCTVGGGGTSRPSGVAERWLQAISDTGRAGVREDALERARSHGDIAAARHILGDDRFEADASRFTDLEIGAAEISADEARVPIRVTRRLADDERDAVFATAVLQRVEGEWRVVDVGDPREGELVPSRGGARPATATARHWLAAVAFGLLAAVASALVIEAQPAVRMTTSPGYVAAAPQRPLTEENQQWRSTSS